ncbi:hypothetical protein EUGRSUZ_K00824 [Eucalyptus grandis]|uniref:Uncharacterized protein n=1 Tax=Eucalyptus grandis TaxID=71139 RepID=A0ACC3IRF9_EUCGR|nr:hypothetical protein EUGRSUZ_K00824 [Eucalyptus grandis]
MEVVCPIDEKCAPEISALLQPLPPREIQDYLDQLLASREGCRLKVRQDGDFGKGVYADVDFKEGELLLRDQILFGCQHPSNKMSYDDSGERTSGSKRAKVPLPQEIVESLMNGEIVLPCSDKFSLPPVIPCSGGCQGAYYCSEVCADTDWNSSRSLLCTKEKSETFSTKALLQFIQHANETNDIFILAAKAVAYTILRYRKSKAIFLSSYMKDTAHVMDNFHMPLLLEAWKPISVGHKRRHIFDKECEPLFSLDIYGHIIGMFELNKLDLVVASPVEDYFLYIDDLPSPEKDRDGQATIVALKAISKGEEVTISYVEEDLPLEGRSALRADYGFICKCVKCQEKS